MTFWLNIFDGPRNPLKRIHFWAVLKLYILSRSKYDDERRETECIKYLDEFYVNAELDNQEYAIFLID